MSTIWETHYAKWNVLGYISKDARETIKDFVDGCEKNEFKKSYTLNNEVRKELHAICTDMKFNHHSSGEGESRKLEISVSSTFKFATPSDRTRNNWERKKKQREQRIKREYYETNVLPRKLSKKYCGDCGRNGMECDLGWARDGSIQCAECNDQDEILSCYKWEPMY